MKELNLEQMERIEGGLFAIIMIVWGLGVLGIGEHNGWWDIF